MALTSATPQLPNAGSTAPPKPVTTPIDSSDTDVGNGIKIPQMSAPNINPQNNTDAAATLKSGAAMTQAMNNVAANAGKSSGGGGFLGGLLGGVGKAIGGLFGGLFAQGGYVGYAEGGPTMNPDNTYGPGQAIEPPPAQPANPNAPGNVSMDDAYGIGYAVGALHQRDFGGTPDTLGEAAAAIAKMLASNNSGQGFASGGSAGDMPVPKPVQPANPSLTSPTPTQSTTQPVLPPKPVQPRTQGFMQPNMGIPSSGSRGPQGGMPAPTQATGYNMNTNPFSGGYVPHMAMGGPPPMQQPGAATPPLKPGEPFVGEGAVKGPGGPEDDMIPAQLSNGEYVMSAAATAFFGVDKMDKMNEQGKQGFMQSKMQVQQNQMEPPGTGPTRPKPPGMAPQPMPGMPPGMPPMGQAKGGPAVKRTRNSGFMG